MRAAMAGQFLLWPVEVALVACRSGTSFGPDMAFVTRHYPRGETVMNKILELGTTIASSRVVAVMRDSGT